MQTKTLLTPFVLAGALFLGACINKGETAENPDLTPEQIEELEQLAIDMQNLTVELSCVFRFAREYPREFVDPGVENLPEEEQWDALLRANWQNVVNAGMVVEVEPENVDSFDLDDPRIDRTNNLIICSNHTPDVLKP